MHDPTQIPAREPLDSDEMEKLRGTVVIDERRRRPLYFDGRFLAARDLTREQNYFLTRQADLGRAGGFGVVHGLTVERAGSPGGLRIAPGHGITPAGETVVLPEALTVDLADVPTIQRLDASFGLIEIPREPVRTRSGLFVVALRPVEFTANPIASYPTSLTGNRTVEDGEIIEATAVTLIPYPDEGAGSNAALRRARVAREVFVAGGAKGVAPGVLPLAMVAVNRGTVEWVDVFMVRRELGADHGDVLGLGFAPRALREAHLLQYENHLREILATRGNLGQRFAATDHFQALPPAGRLPTAAIDPDDFTQIFFPATVDVDLSIVPADEIPALLEESLLLPPIDLTLSAEELDSAGVLVLIPVPRNRLRTLSSRLSHTDRSLRSATPWLVAKRRPLEVLQGLRIPGNFVPLPEPEDAEDAIWRELLVSDGMLWYVRRRNLSYRAELAGESVLVEQPIKIQPVDLVTLAARTEGSKDPVTATALRTLATKQVEDAEAARAQAEKAAQEKEAARIEAEKEAQAKEAARLEAEKEAQEKEAARIEAEKEAQASEAARLKAQREAEALEAARRAAEKEAETLEAAKLRAKEEDLERITQEADAARTLAIKQAEEAETAKRLLAEEAAKAEATRLRAAEDAEAAEAAKLILAREEAAAKAAELASVTATKEASDAKAREAASTFTVKEAVDAKAEIDAKTAVATEGVVSERDVTLRTEELVKAIESPQLHSISTNLPLGR